jgi:chitin synthase
MNGRSTPSLPPEYSYGSYDDDNDHHTPTGPNPAAVRLLTSMEEPLTGAEPYVAPQMAPSLPLNLVPPPLALQRDS